MLLLRAGGQTFCLAIRNVRHGFTTGRSNLWMIQGNAKAPGYSSHFLVFSKNLVTVLVTLLPKLILLFLHSPKENGGKREGSSWKANQTKSRAAVFANKSIPGPDSGTHSTSRPLLLVQRQVNYLLTFVKSGCPNWLLWKWRARLLCKCFYY